MTWTLQKNTHTKHVNTSLHSLYTLTQHRKWHVVKSIFKCGNNEVSSKHPHWGVWHLKLMHCCFFPSSCPLNKNQGLLWVIYPPTRLRPARFLREKKSPQDPHCCYPKKYPLQASQNSAPQNNCWSIEGMLTHHKVHHKSPYFVMCHTCNQHHGSIFKINWEQKCISKKITVFCCIWYHTDMISVLLGTMPGKQHDSNFERFGKISQCFFVV